jgi:hypothetical protein
MISIADMRNIATAEKEAEEKAKEVKFQKNLAMYRDKVRKVQPQVVEYIQRQIINAMKNNRVQVGLHRYSMEKIFKDILRYPSESNMIYFFLWSPDSEAHTAIDTVFKEMALEIRDELFKAGIKKIQKGGPFAGDPSVIVILREENNMIKKTAINKCPICGGWVALKTSVDVVYTLHEDDGELVTETDDIIDRVYNKTPIEATCDDCGAILDVINVNTEKSEFTFRAEVK